MENPLEPGSEPVQRRWIVRGGVIAIGALVLIGYGQRWGDLGSASGSVGEAGCGGAAPVDSAQKTDNELVLTGPGTGPITGPVSFPAGVGKVVFRQYPPSIEAWLNLIGAMFSGVTISSQGAPSGGYISTLASTYGLDLAALELDPIDVDDRASCKKGALGNMRVKADYSVKIGSVNFAFDATSNRIQATASIDKVDFDNTKIESYSYISSTSWPACILNPITCGIVLTTCQHYESCGGYYCLPLSATFDDVSITALELSYELKAALSSGQLKVTRSKTTIASGYKVNDPSSKLVETLLNAFKSTFVDQSWFDVVGDQLATIAGELYGVTASSDYKVNQPWSSLGDAQISVAAKDEGIGSEHSDVSGTVTYDVAASRVRNDYQATTTLDSSVNYPYGTSINTAVPNQLLVNAYDKAQFTYVNSADTTGTFRTYLPGLPNGQTFAYSVTATSTPYVDFSTKSTPALRFPAVTVTMSVAGVPVAEVRYDVSVVLAVAVSATGGISLTPSYASTDVTVNSTTIVSQAGSLATTTAATFGVAAFKFLSKAYFHGSLNIMKTGFHANLLWPGNLIRNSCSSGWLNLYFNFTQ